MLSPSSEAVVVLADYTVKYGRFTAVDRVSFEMPPGACGLLGQNGAGKSSIIKAVLGLVQAAGGQAHVLGLDAQRYGPQLRDRVGYMPEKEASIPGLTGLDAVILAAQLSGLPAAFSKQRAHEVLWLVGLDEARYRDVGTYSLGMKQRVKLAIALVHDPDLLFLDEPTNGLDPEGREEILALLADLVHVKGKSLILSSHILSDVETLCDRAVLIEKGRVIAEGTIEELTRGQARGYELLVSGPGDGPTDYSALRDKLAARGLLHGEPEGARISIRLAQGEATAVVFELVREAGLQIRRFEPARRSLSDVFLDSVRSKHGLQAAGPREIEA